jgi:hypothetical protein
MWRRLPIDFAVGRNPIRTAVIARLDRAIR